MPRRLWQGMLLVLLVALLFGAMRVDRGFVTGPAAGFVTVLWGLFAIERRLERIDAPWAGFLSALVALLALLVGVVLSLFLVVALMLLIQAYD